MGRGLNYNESKEAFREEARSSMLEVRRKDEG
jgi:hypothetical protein